MPGTCSRATQSEEGRPDRAAWLRALAQAIELGQYRPDADEIARTLLPMLWRPDGRPRSGRR